MLDGKKIEEIERNEKVLAEIVANFKTKDKSSVSSEKL